MTFRSAFQRTWIRWVSLILLALCLNTLFIQCAPYKPSELNSTNSQTAGPNPGNSPRPSPGVSSIPSPISSPMVSPGVSPALSPSAWYFPPGNIWEQDISNATQFPKDSDSDSVIANLISHGGWGTGSMRTDTSIHVNIADSSTPKVGFTEKSTYYLPDCDPISQVPLPAGGAIEGYNDYSCPNGGDCHLIVWDQFAKKLFESWDTARLSNGNMTATCMVVWDLTKNYPAGRGDGCTSADAAGFPIAPLLFTADEVAAGEIKHAIRFILPNDRWRRTLFVHPATHSGGFGNTNAGGVLYGSRFRLKASVNINGLSPEAQVVARALKKYGMFAADGGNIALTAMSDRTTVHKWSEFTPVADPRYAPIDLHTLQVSDFEVVNSGRPIGDAADGCTRLPGP